MLKLSLPAWLERAILALAAFFSGVASERRRQEDAQKADEDKVESKRAEVDALPPDQLKKRLTRWRAR